jgi:CspA family cold shock protein
MTALRLLASGAQVRIVFSACTSKLLPQYVPRPFRNVPWIHRLRAAGASRAFDKELAMPTGVVKWFNETKGFGFIKPDDGGSDVFAHYSGIKSKGFRTLKENQRVEYQVQQGQKGPQAVEIVPLA